jgi:hypothetical protein
MAKKKLYKSKTNFTLKRLHQSGNYGKIFERDYTTISNTGASPSGQIPIYNSPSFKFTIGVGYNGQKLYKYGNWLQNNAICAQSNPKLWTLGCMTASSQNDSKIILKPNSKKLTDFVCYGSAVELIRATLTNIISNFPAELYFTNDTLVSMGILVENNNISEYADIKEKVTNGSDEVYMYKDYILIDNPLLIDITQKSLPEDGIFNGLRYFCKSFDKYEIILKTGEKKPIKEWEVDSEEYYDNCLENGKKLATITITDDKKQVLNILCFYYEGQLMFITNNSDINSIRPNKNEIDKYFSGLNDFEKVLLNQYTNYIAKFETYIEDEEYGWRVTERQYQWPLNQGGWNLSVNGIKYNEYRDKLFNLASACDELYSNAIWRDMTHDAIKNMDLTLYKNGELVDFTLSSKIQKLINIIGRQFDEIKKYIDNIKHSNNISYTQENNTPDYFLTDNLELCGWETKEILSDISKDLLIDNFYDNTLKGYTAVDANNEFLRRLILNSSNILSKKGTKQAIEDLMGIFGFHTTDWYIKYKNYHYNDGFVDESIGVGQDDINDLDIIKGKLFSIEEYVYVVNGLSGVETTDNEKMESIKSINELKKSFNIDDINSDKELNPYYGLPVAEITVPLDNNEYSTCLIPWFDRNQEYDGDLYYQMNGGWSKYGGIYEKTISNIHYVNSKKELEELPYNIIDFTGLYYVGDNKEYYHYNNDWIYIRDNNDMYDNIVIDDLNVIKDGKSDLLYYVIKGGIYYQHKDNEWKVFDVIENYKIIFINTQDKLPKDGDTNRYYVKEEKNIYKYDGKWVIDDKFTIEFNNVVITKESLPILSSSDNNMYYVIEDKSNYVFKNDSWTKIEPDNDVLTLFNNIIDNNKGNNPHNGNYDDGVSYIEPYKKFFKNSEFDDSVPVSRITNKDEYGFKLTEALDTLKCHYFSNQDNCFEYGDKCDIYNNIIKTNKKWEDLKNKSTDLLYYVMEYGTYYYYNSDKNDWENFDRLVRYIDTKNELPDIDNLLYYVIGEKSLYQYNSNHKDWEKLNKFSNISNVIITNEELLNLTGEDEIAYYVIGDKSFYVFKNNIWIKIEPVESVLRNYTKHSSYTFSVTAKDNMLKNELNSLRIINVKKLKLLFPENYKDLIINDVLPYLRQIIPSTAIFEYEFK